MASALRRLRLALARELSGADASRPIEELSRASHELLLAALAGSITGGEVPSLGLGRACTVWMAAPGAESAPGSGPALGSGPAPEVDAVLEAWGPEVAPEHLLGASHELCRGESLTRANGELVIVPAVAGNNRSAGVYYTPTELVRLLVDRVLGPRVDRVLSEAAELARGGRALEAREAAEQVLELCVVDPACGSGAFLLGVFDLFSEALERWNLAQPTAAVADAHRRVLEGCLYGVDVDEMAVEVSRISLAVRLARRAPGAEMATSIAALSRHLRTGDSLLDPYEDSTGAAGGFDWRGRFPEVFARSEGGGRGDGGAGGDGGRAGGFDAVVGNPPYFGLEAIFGRDASVTRLLGRRYPHIHTDKTNVLYYFFARGVELLSPGGDLAFVASRSLFQADKARRLREFLARRTTLEYVLDFVDAPLFDAGIATAVVHLQNAAPPPLHELRVDFAPDSDSARRTLARDPSLVTPRIEVLQSSLSSGPWPLSPFRGLFDRIDASGPKLADLPEFDRVEQGIETGRNDVFVGPWRGRLDPSLLRDCVKGSQIFAYGFGAAPDQLLYVTSEDPFEELPESVRAFLLEHENSLRARAAVHEKSCAWYALHRSRRRGLHSHFRPKLLVPYRARHSRFAVDQEGALAGLTDTSAFFVRDDAVETLFALSAILNSPVAEFRLSALGGLSKATGNGMGEYFKTTLSALPVPAGFAGEVPRLAKLARAAHGHRARGSGATGEGGAVLEEIAGIAYRLYGVEGERVAIEAALRSRG